jgi:uncharacterized membrane protein YbhN (UPF0104 family)
LKKILVGSLKVGLSVAIVFWLLWDALTDDPEAVSRLRTGEKDWWLLVVAAVACTSAVAITLVRWCYLVRALGLSFRMKDAFRIGFLGYLFNLAPMGIVGGDLLKAWLLAREYRGHRPEALASIIVDRVIGLYTLFCLASIAILATGFWTVPNDEIRYICQATLVLTGIGTLGILALLGPQVIVGKLVQLVGRVPHAGPPVEKLIVAVRMYRHKLPVLLAAALMSLAVHSLFSTGIHLIAQGLPGAALSLHHHFVVAPLSAATNVIPLPAGPQEGALKFLYGALAEAPLKGLIVSLTYRIITVLIAAVGIAYYLTSRREVEEVLHEVEAEREDIVHDSPPVSQAVA